MSLRGVRKLQIISVILFGASLLLSLIVIVFQGAFKPLFTMVPDVLSCYVVPWPALAGSVTALVFAVLFLVFCMTVRSAKASRIIVVILLIAKLVYGVILSPLFSSLSTVAVNAYGSTYIASWGTVTRGLSLFTALPSFAGNLLMFLAMGGFFGNGRDTEEKPAGMTVRGVRKLHIAAAVLCGAALLMFLLIILLRNPLLRLFNTPEDVLASASSPTLYILFLTDLLLSVALIVISMLLVLRRRSAAGTRKVTVLMSVLRSVGFLVSTLYSVLVVVFLGNYYGIWMLASYNILSSVFSFLVSPLTGIAGTLMLFALGGYYNKEALQ